MIYGYISCKVVNKETNQWCILRKGDGRLIQIDKWLYANMFYVKIFMYKFCDSILWLLINKAPAILNHIGYESLYYTNTFDNTTKQMKSRLEFLGWKGRKLSIVYTSYLNQRTFYNLTIRCIIYKKICLRTF